MKRIQGITKHRFHIYLVIGLLFFIGLFPILDSNRYHINMGIMVGIFSIVAIGFNLLLGNTGQISLGQAAFYGIGAYASAILTAKTGFSFWVALPSAAIFCGVIGYILGFSSVRFKGSYLAMATLSFGVIFSIIILEWTTVTGGAGGYPEMIPRPSIGAFKIDNELKYYYLVWAFLIAVFIFTKNLIQSRIGRALYAIQGNETVANVIGINPTRYKLKVFTLSAIYAGIAGSLYAHYATYISEESFTFLFSVSLLCMVVIGGLGSVWGSVVGTAVLYLLSEIIRYMAKFSVLPQAVRNILAEYSYLLLAYGLFVAIFIVFLPRGIIGLFRERGKGKA